MNANMRLKNMVRTRQWVIGSAALLLLLSAGGLTIVADHARAQHDVVMMLLALHVASWFYALGVGGLVLVPMLAGIDWKRWRRWRVANERMAAVERHRAVLSPTCPSAVTDGCTGTTSRTKVA